MDFLDRLIDKVADIGTFAGSNIDVGTLSSDNCLCIRPAPSAQPLKYYDFSSYVFFNFQVLVRHSEQPMSYNTMQKVTSILDNLVKGDITSHNDSFNFIKCRVTTPTNFVEVDNHGFIYTALFQAELFVKRGLSI